MKTLSLMLTICLTSITLFAQKTFTVEGTVAEGQNYEQFVLEDFLNETIIDIAEVENSKFKFTAEIEHSAYYRVIAEDQTYILLIPEPGDNIKLIYDINTLNQPYITGSKHTGLFYEQVKLTEELDLKLQEFQNKLTTEREKQVQKLVKENPNSLAALAFVDELDIEEHFELYQQLAEGLKHIQNNEMVDALIQNVSGSRLLEIGTVAPDIDLPNPEGDYIKLSELRGNYVLIEFWAAWCRPCRMENPNLVAAHNKYKRHGFEIYAVSLDRTKNEWLKAIEDDNLENWVHVSQLEADNPMAAEDYNVTAIPFNVLIDKEGKIIAKTLRGDALQDKLAEIFD